MLHNFLRGTCLACVDDHRHKPQSCTYVSKHGRKLESRLLIASGADSAECALMHSFMLVSEISCFGGKKWSTGLVCGLGFYQFQSKLVLRSVAKGFGQCVRFRVRLQILNNSFSGAPQSDIYQCACPQAGRQMWRMTSCSEICGSEYAEQAQPSGNCQQYGVRSYLHQVLDMHTHRDNRRTSTDQPVTNVNSSVQSHTSWSWELISDCLTRILHLNFGWIFTPGIETAFVSTLQFYEECTASIWERDEDFQIQRSPSRWSSILWKVKQTFAHITHATTPNNDLQFFCSSCALLCRT